MARRDKGAERAIARERVERLIALAVEALRQGHGARADRYAEMAWRLKTTYQLRSSPIAERRCRACGAFLQPGVTARVRLTGGRRSVTCLACGAVRRKVLKARRVADEE